MYKKGMLKLFIINLTQKKFCAMIRSYKIPNDDEIQDDFVHLFYDKNEFTLVPAPRS